MGFMDKAKQMAEQAQQKIEDAQKQFNESQAQKGAQAQPAPQSGIRYDANGRPIQEQPPATGANETPSQTPVPTSPTPDAAVAAAESEAAETGAAEQPVPPPAPPKDGVNSNPDPFKPLS